MQNLCPFAMRILVFCGRTLAVRIVPKCDWMTSGGCLVARWVFGRDTFVGSFPNRIQALRTQSLVTPRGSQRNHFEIPERSFAAFSARTLLLAIPGAHILREILQRRQVFDWTGPQGTALL